ncbi:hypothetical protein N665_0901s0001 [Sinapis alba]|nr:hypothetical protein N665_0901s0001 [Sinapis alba]
MVVTLILVRDENGDLRDPDGHLRNAACQKIDNQGTIIPDTEAEAYAAEADAAEAQPESNAQAAQRTLADYNRPDQFYANRSVIRPPAF